MITGIILDETQKWSRICPECRSGKHPNCDGTAFDDVADDIVECRCPPAFHPEKRTS